MIPNLPELYERVRDIDAIRQRTADARAEVARTAEMHREARGALATATAALETEEAALLAWLSGDAPPAPVLPPEPRRRGRPRKAPPSPQVTSTPEVPAVGTTAGQETTTPAERALTPGGDWLSEDVQPMPEHMVTAYLMVSTDRERQARAMLAGKVPDADAAIAALRDLGLLDGDLARDAYGAWCPADSPMRASLPLVLARYTVDGDQPAMIDALRAMLAKGAA